MWQLYIHDVYAYAYVCVCVLWQSFEIQWDKHCAINWSIYWFGTSIIKETIHSNNADDDVVDLQEFCESSYSGSNTVQETTKERHFICRSHIKRLQNFQFIWLPWWYLNALHLQSDKKKMAYTHVCNTLTAHTHTHTSSQHLKTMK